MNSPTTAKLTDKLAAWCNRTQFQLTVKVIYPKYYKVGFPTGQDTKTFGDKGTMGQAENLTKGWNGTGQLVKIQDRMQDKTIQSRK